MQRYRDKIDCAVAVYSRLRAEISHVVIQLFGKSNSHSNTYLVNSSSGKSSGQEPSSPGLTVLENHAVLGIKWTINDHASPLSRRSCIRECIKFQSRRGHNREMDKCTPCNLRRYGVVWKVVMGPVPAFGVFVEI